MRSNSSKVNKQQRVIQVTAAERTREIGEAAHIARSLSEWEFTERGTCGTLRNTRNLTPNDRPCR